MSLCFVTIITFYENIGSNTCNVIVLFVIICYSFDIQIIERIKYYWLKRTAAYP